MNASHLQLTITATVGRQYVQFLQTNLLMASGMVQSSLEELSVALVDDRRMSRLHREFMEDEETTDVMTFPLELNSRNKPTSGEIVVCVPEARRRAREMKTRIEHELLLYAVHGLLHLSGFDDKTAAAYNRIHRMEDTILRRLGVGAVFAPKGRR